MYTVVAEMSSKTDDQEGGLEQNAEQMLGLFAAGQTLMLGLVVHNLTLKPMLLHLVDGDLTLTEMQELSLQPQDITKSLSLLMRVLIGVNFISGP